MFRRPSRAVVEFYVFQPHVVRGAGVVTRQNHVVIVCSSLSCERQNSVNFQFKVTDWCAVFVCYLNLRTVTKLSDIVTERHKYRIHLQTNTKIWDTSTD